MGQREYSESSYYHVTVRTAGQIALFEDDGDRKMLLRLLKRARDERRVRIIAWVLMTDHFHLVLDTGDDPKAISSFMYDVNRAYARYFNDKTGRSGALVQAKYWSKPIAGDSQLVATVHYVHMNPEAAGICSMRSWRWSSYQEYAGRRWMVDTSTVLGIFGGFQEFDAYTGSSVDVVAERKPNSASDDDVLERAMELAGVKSSSDLRSLPRLRRNELVVQLRLSGATVRQIARTFGIGIGTVSRALAEWNKHPG